MTHSDSPGQDAALGRFLTLTDTADVLNISASQAYALVRSGELPAIKVGGHGHWRVERSVLESYIEAKYEESRRMSLWQQSDYASLSEYSFGLRGAPGSTPVELDSQPDEKQPGKRHDPVVRDQVFTANRACLVHGEIEVIPTHPIDRAADHTLAHHELDRLTPSTQIS